MSRDEPWAAVFTGKPGGEARLSVGVEALAIWQDGEQKSPLPVTGERPTTAGNAIYSPSSSALVGAAFLKSLAGRTFFSPGKGPRVVGGFRTRSGD